MISINSQLIVEKLGFWLISSKFSIDIAVNVVSLSSFDLIESKLPSLQTLVEVKDFVLINPATTTKKWFRIQW